MSGTHLQEPVPRLCHELLIRNHPVARAKYLVFLIFLVAPNPREWTAGLGWRSHRVATPGGQPRRQPRRGCREVDNRGPRKMVAMQYGPLRNELD